MRLSRTLSLYLARQFATAYFGVLAAIMGVIFLSNLIELVRRAAGRPGLGMGVLSELAFFQLPELVHVVMPFVMLIAAMVAFFRLTRSHELVVARAAGVSVWQFLAPVLILVLGIGVFELTVINPISAAMYARYESMQNALINHGGVLDVSGSGLWLREGAPHGGQVVLHADYVHERGLILYLRDVEIFRFDRPGHFSERLSAQSARLVKNAFDMTDVWVMIPGEPSVHKQTLVMPTTLTLARVHDNFASPETLSVWQLPGFIAFFEKAGFAAPRARMYLNSLISSPFLYCAMVLLAAVFSLKPDLRSGGMVWRVAGGVAAGFLFYFFSKVIYAFGLSQTVPQILAAWAPALMAGFAGVGGLLHLEDG